MTCPTRPWRPPVDQHGRLCSLILSAVHRSACGRASGSSAGGPGPHQRLRRSPVCGRRPPGGETGTPSTAAPVHSHSELGSFRSSDTATSAPSGPPPVCSEVDVSLSHTHTHAGAAVTCTDGRCPCLSAGKWTYEVLISSQGLMQIGWCTLSCRFNQEVRTCTRTSTGCMNELKPCDCFTH